jgi:hypothetical protein
MVALSPITSSVNDLFTLTGLAVEPPSPVGVADALGAAAALLSVGAAGADTGCDGMVEPADELSELLLHAVSNALPAITAARAGKMV